MTNGDRISELYKGEIWSERVQRAARSRIDWLVAQASGDVLDLGCSQGIAALLCARRGLRTLGLDIEADRIEYALADREREPGVVRELLAYRVADARRLDVPDASFDTVLLGEVVEHHLDASPVLAEAARVLRPDGRLALTTPFGYHPHHDHRATFYVASLVALAAPYFTVDSLDVVDGYLRAVLTPGPMDAAAARDLVHAMQPVLEQEFLRTERELSEQRRRADTATKEKTASYERLEARLDAIAAQQDATIADLEAKVAALREENARLGETLRREKAAAEERVRAARRQAAGLEQTAGKLKDVEGKLAYQEYRTRYLDWQLKSTQNRRWWRVGESLFGVRQDPRRGLLALPADILRASVKMPMPQPPEKPAHRRERTITVSATGAQATRTMPEIPKIVLPDGPVNRPDLTVLTILDTFSASAFRFEWRQVEPGPDDWREVVARERPDLLFVESAWAGNEGRWRLQMSGKNAPGRELRELVAHCREKGIPTVFWNKEDPPNFDVFIETAKLFDTVFTTADDVIPRYRELLGHDRVAVLPFAAQPRLHNPVSVPGGRRNDVAFAGTYFSHKHPRRAEQMTTVLEPARSFGLHIYSRMLGEEDRFQFPSGLAEHVVGSLPYDRMLTAYKAYKVFLNVNSVLDSPTMCARRIFELSACRTPVLSGHSAAIEKFFPGLVAVTRTEEETRTLLGGLLANSELRDRQAHLAMREVFAQHTFGHRVDTVLEHVGLSRPLPRPAVSVILPTNRPDRLPAALEQIGRQHWKELQLVVVLHGLDVQPEKVQARAAEAGIDNVVVLEADAALPLGACLNLGIEAADGDLIAKMDDDDIYGEHYLSDLVPAFSYTDAGIVGKQACYVRLEASNATLLSKPEAEHAYTSLVRGGTIVARGDVLRDLRFDPLPRGSDTQLQRRAKLAGVRIYSADRFNYVYVRGADPSAHTFPVQDAELLKQARVEFYGPPEAHVCI
ncbi:methyltransferase domain-containing protein [Actinomadura rayongensis]|uniref:Methyltransferase domain-containing protein n=1 Tax=Actinomadura rayongensis TaxID=1429076 RepID=A0A6I4W929_9ACTN|nr:methyltransferase domain-containing protein [Actinomadura rayongensis]MXQ64775.1 methyltransferase domain-containing protein [Actinomadura rayongensis]